MQLIQVAKLKRDFSNILNLVQNKGEKFVIEYGRSHKKVAMIIPYEEEKNEKREFGICRGKGSFTL
ncbi:MAG: type II toxin-antitoxin system Phd/YefM family antitoxin, partial [Nitrospinae bacterium]|nr:type II toxin-antitoxin system Phd/YefM family antitoxin [Nitrospinota bacterium]